MRLDMPENRISELENSQQKPPKLKGTQEKNETEAQKNIWELWDIYKRYTIHIMGIPDGEKNRRNI